jgi:polyisoprenoid-binding protein YceI
MNKAFLAVVAVAAVGGGVYFFLQTQKDDTSAVGTRAAPPPSLSAQAGSSGAHGVTRYAIADRGLAGFLIDAPLEKIKGHADKLRGAIDLDTDALATSSGEVDVDLDSLVTDTFGDPSKDTAQTTHAHNWMELGADSPNHEADRWARFTFARATNAEGFTKLSDVPVTGGERHFKLSVPGNLWLHGITSPKTLVLNVVAKLGATPDAAPASLHIESATPMPVSLKEHDVKPRDVAGKFLAGSLEKVGDKITDTAQVSVTADANPASALASAFLDASAK